jgi:hypothetical protein
LIKTAASPKIALSVWKYFRIASGIVSTDGLKGSLNGLAEQRKRRDNMNCLAFYNVLIEFSHSVARLLVAQVNLVVYFDSLCNHDCNDGC